jgi:hypothetical protein
MLMPSALGIRDAGITASAVSRERAHTKASVWQTRFFVPENSVGFLARLFSKSNDDQTNRITDAEATRIIQAYGKALMDCVGVYGDVAQLPYPKARIKEALIHGMRTTDDPKFREQLKGAFMTLAQWQAGASKGPGEFSDEELKDPQKALARASSPDFLKIPETVSVEAKALLAELNALESSLSK